MRLYSVILLTLSCSSNGLTDKIERLGVDKFKSIEYGVRGDIEIYTYYFGDGENYVWTYNQKMDRFDFEKHPNKSRAIDELGDITNYGDKLRNNIKSLNIVSISQSPWTGNLIRFWISHKNFICYVNPDFKFDSGAKKRWLDELARGRRLNDNWYSVDIKD